ncbi:MAG: RNA methyltransferase [Patescibacteria group bacterium]|nr:RNA methyltransferase [Patescibacteria group bacterium]
MLKKFYLILPNIRSCFNVGAMFRTADACGVDKIFLVGFTPAPPNPRIDKVSLGAETWVPFETRQNLPELINQLKQEGFTIIGLEKTEQSRLINSINYSGNIALIVGNEVDGIPIETQTLCEHVVHIPMYGNKESLNVSIAAGIAMYHIKNN